MSLDFSVEGMRNFQVLTSLPRNDGTEGERWHPLTDALIWGAMAIGKRDITAENWRDFYKRIHALELINGPRLMRGKFNSNDPRNFITPLEVYMHIGLSTNVSHMTEKQFAEKLWEYAQGSVFRAGLDRASEVYDELELDQLTKEQWFPVWNTMGRDLERYDTEFLVREAKSTDPIAGGQDRNIGSVVEE
jgi:hypothetical protein